MNKLYKIVLLFGLVVITANVNSQNSVFKLDIDKQEKLLPLIIEIDEESIARAYTSNIVSNSTGYYADEYSEEYVSTTFSEDPKVNDIYLLLDSYLKDYFTTEMDSVLGRIRMDVLFYDYEFRATPGFFINTFTFGLGYILGIPATKKKTVVELRAEIYDINQKLLKSYYGSGIEIGRGGIFYKNKNPRFMNLEAMKIAIKSINSQLLADREIIEIELESVLP